jgi:2-keto-4-pentenoate hydratase/2-oxohepta-3-ene-1,7-dioic acid hydratase in catechol pathway
MKFVSFKAGDRCSYGVMSGDSIQEPDDAYLRQHPDLRSAIAADKLTSLEAGGRGEKHTAANVDFLPPIPNPDKVLCVGANYRPHIEEMGRKIPDYPVVFVRFPGSQSGHEQAIIRPSVSKSFDFEGELAVVIGKRARHVQRADAFDCIAGYSCFMDGSVRDWQNHTMQFTGGKNFHRSGAMGPFLVTRDEIQDPTSLSLTTRVDGEVMQQGDISDLVFDIPALIEYCSTFAELLPGDVIATGTPGGVGAARTPPRWLEAGNLVEVEVSGLGTLRNAVANEK